MSVRRQRCLAPEARARVACHSRDTTVVTTSTMMMTSPFTEFRQYGMMNDTLLYIQSNIQLLYIEYLLLMQRSSPMNGPSGFQTRVFSLVASVLGFMDTFSAFLSSNTPIADVRSDSTHRLLSFPRSGSLPCSSSVMSIKPAMSPRACPTRPSLAAFLLQIDINFQCSNPEWKDSLTLMTSSCPTSHHPQSASSASEKPVPRVPCYHENPLDSFTPRASDKFSPTAGRNSLKAFKPRIDRVQARPLLEQDVPDFFRLCIHFIYARLDVLKLGANMLCVAIPYESELLVSFCLRSDDIIESFVET